MAKIFHKIKKGLNLEPQSSAPASPEEGDLYYNFTDGLQIRTAAGWVSPGAGSGSGELNLIDNPNDANQNWFLSAGTGDISFATTNVAAELPLEGIISTAIKFTSSVSGTKYAYTRFKMPDTLLTAKQKLEWYQKLILGFNANEWTVELWWNSNSSYSGTYTQFPLRSDVSGISFVPVLTGHYYTQWNNIQAAQYLEMRVSRPSGSGLATFSVTNIIAGPGVNTIDQSDQSPAMAGTIIPYSGPTTGFTSIGSDGTTLVVKNGWALCNGASISQTLYSQLFANLGTTWDTSSRQDGTGGTYSAPSAGFFRIPDLRGVFLRGVGTSSRSNGSGGVAKTLAQFNNDTTAPNALAISSSTTINNTDLTHTHAATGLTVSGTNSTSAVTGITGSNGTSSISGTANSGVNLTHNHTQADYSVGGGGPVVGSRFDIYAAGTYGNTNVNTFNSGTLDHSHSLTGTAAAQAWSQTGNGTAAAQAWSGSVAGSTAGPSTTLNHAHTAATTSTPSSTDLETAPRNTGVNYLVKLYDAQTLQSINTQATSPVKAGFIIAGAQSVAPDGWILCGGQAVSRTTYSELFTAIGTTYGAGDVSTTFNVPDLRGRVVAGKDDMGGSAASRLTLAIAGITSTTLGAAGGNENVHGHSHTSGTLANATSAISGTINNTDLTHTHAATGLTVSGTNLSSPISGSTASHGHELRFDGSLGGGRKIYGDHIGVGGTSIFTPAGWTIQTPTSFSDPGIAETVGALGVSGTAAAQAWSGSVAGSTAGPSTTLNHAHTFALTAAAQTISGSTGSFGTGTSQNVQPTMVLNYFIKAFNDTVDVTGFNNAGPTSTGFVTNSAQTIGGLKTFQDGIITPFISAGAPSVITGTSTISTGGLTLANSASPITANLLTAVGIDGTQITIKNINTGIVTVDPNGSQTIDGQTTIALNQYDSITILAYSGNWYLI